MSQILSTQFGAIPVTIVETLTGNTGGAVGPTGNNINIVGTGVVTVTGNPATSTLTISDSGAVADSFVTGSGTATPSGGVLNVPNGSNINTIGSGNTLTINLVNSPSVSGTVTAAGNIFASTNLAILGLGPLAQAGRGALTLLSDTNDANDPFIIFQKDRAGAAIQNGDSIGSIAWQGFDGTNFVTGSRIRAVCTGTVATGQIPSDLEFYTNPVNTGGELQRMLIGNAGNVTINTPDSGVALTILGGGLTSAGTTTLSSLSSGIVVSNGSGVLSNGSTTQFDILVGSASNGISGIAPSATSGIPLISQGSSANPIFGTTVVAGGGTGSTTLTSDGILYGNGTSAIGATTAGTNGQVLLGSTSAAPAFATLTSTGGSLTYTTGANALNIDIANYVSTTWTPVLKFGGGTTGVTYNVQTGAYSRVGNILTMCMEIALSAVGSSTGNATITGLTQSVATSNTSLTIFAAGVFSLSGIIEAYYDGTNINLYQISTSGSAAPLTNSAFSSSSQLIISASWVV